ncbi:MlaD family protein [Patulibacter brassicae]|uniref:MlaD family protein n=1 Tax=Patulibacter brassicae TaxID=1705717 RepID=A0ABU4VQV2_9ACTN|nr:MlaD family protein [Patulibacter brassicae]MDX8153258.1 MlaD family protein [Patulibacter brassicae]
MPSSFRLPQLLAVVAVLATVAAAALWLTRDDAYVVRAEFENAGLVVAGGRVEVAGVQIGRIRQVDLAPDGNASLELAITDDRFKPLHRGTKASIRAVGQATITNRYVQLSPAPSSAPALPDGGTIGSEDTFGIVDLDQVLNAVDPPTRRRLQRLIGNSRDVYAGSGAEVFNRMLGELDPSLARVGGLLRDLASGREEIEGMIRAGARVTDALRDRRDPLADATERTAVTMRAIADQGDAMARVLQRAPAVLRRAGGTLTATADTVQELRPTLRAVAPSQPAFRRALRAIPPALDGGDPALARLNALIPPLRTALDALPALRRPTVDALASTQRALDGAMPILEGLRYYSSDIVLGVVNGLLGISSGPYNRYGHYFKVEFMQSPQTAIGGVLSQVVPALTSVSGIVPGVLNTQIDQRRRCPGSNAPPAPDGSNPWYPKAGICDPTQSMSGLVNSPTAICRTASDCVGDRRSLKPDPTGLEDLERARRGDR